MKLWLALGLASVLFLLTGCNGRDASPAPSSVRPSPSPAQVRAELIAALTRTQAVPHRFTLDADLPKKQRLVGSGAFDASNDVYTSRTTSLERIVVGTDYYQREPGDAWVHLDLTRVAADSPAYFETTDATGLGRFAEAITSAHRTGPNTYAGRFAPDSGNDPFLPIGAPSLWSVGLRVSPFTITTDATGWVTSITMQMTPSDSPTLTMAARLSRHGEPLDVREPAAQEADDTYYR